MSKKSETKASANPDRPAIFADDKEYQRAVKERSEQQLQAFKECLNTKTGLLKLVSEQDQPKPKKNNDGQIIKNSADTVGIFFDFDAKKQYEKMGKEIIAKSRAYLAGKVKAIEISKSLDCTGIPIWLTGLPLDFINCQGHQKLEALRTNAKTVIISGSAIKSLEAPAAEGHIDFTGCAALDPKQVKIPASCKAINPPVTKRAIVSDITIKPLTPEQAKDAADKLRLEAEGQEVKSDVKDQTKPGSDPADPKLAGRKSTVTARSA
jgi:hypothetical protein